MTTLFPEIADIRPPRPGRKKHPNCPVCKTPRNLREQVLDEAVAALKDDRLPTSGTAVPHNETRWANERFNDGIERAIYTLSGLKTLPVEESKPTTTGA